jgi:Kdo2-lipid IVA lauroyltransferase/acyltransferase
MRAFLMSSNGTNPSKSLKWRLECLGQSFVEGIAGLLPGPWAFRLGEALADLAWHLMPKRRKVVLRNLRIAFAGEKELPELQRMARATFRRTGGNLISAAHTARLTPAELAKVIRIENLDLLEQAMANGKGVVLLLSHMGNWEVLSRLIHLFPKGAKTGAFYRPLNNPLLDKRVLDRRQADGTRMFSKRDNPLHVAGFLREGGIVGILADQRVDLHGELAPFFGRLTRVSPLPSLLARRAKASLLSLAVTTDTPGHWTATFMPVDTPPHTVNCMVALERAMKSGPVDVFWLQERWKLNLKATVTIRDWLGPGDEQKGKPYRALLWLSHAPATWTLPDTWKHPDVIYEVVLAESQTLPPSISAETHIHRISSLADHRSVLNELISIDAARSLPVDYILAPQAPGMLIQAGKIEQIPVVVIQ